MYNLSLFFFFSSRMFEPTFGLFRHFVYLDLSRNLVPRSSHSLRLSRHFEYISILVGNFGHVILLCASRRHIEKREDPGDEVGQEMKKHAEET